MRSKQEFEAALNELAATLVNEVSADDGQWTIKGFVDTFRQVYTISSDTKVVSKILEIHLFPKILAFADQHGFAVVLAEHQNYYPDISFVSKADETSKFAVDFKTTYRNGNRPWLCNGFTLGSHGQYFENRTSTKNIQFPYGSYWAHYCLGIIYNRSANAASEKSGPRSLDDLHSIASVISNFRFFIAEKWKIAGDKPGSGNTANIGSIQRIEDILSGNGMFANLGEDWFDDYCWMNFGKITVKTDSGDTKRVTTLEDFVKYRGGDASLDSSKKQSTMNVLHPVVPPIKCQGIKTKLVPWIGAVKPSTLNGTWIEPFMGSGVVAFSIRPKRALLADSNPHLINFYRAIAEGSITAASTRRFLEIEGRELFRSDGEHYYKVRERFNREGSPLDFLFLNRAGFNGLIRFNRKGGYNVPFCRKPNRFAQAYITKIANQVQAVIDIVAFGNYEFVCQDFADSVDSAEVGDLIYCDPPYIDRHTDYFNQWDAESERKLARSLSTVPCSFILSVWHSNQFRKNTFVESLWSDFHVCTRQHFYHVGGKEVNRNQMTEALVTNFVPELNQLPRESPTQLLLLETSAQYQIDPG